MNIFPVQNVRCCTEPSHSKALFSDYKFFHCHYCISEASNTRYSHILPLLFSSCIPSHLQNVFSDTALITNFTSALTIFPRVNVVKGQISFVSKNALSLLNWNVANQLWCLWYFRADDNFRLKPWCDKKSKICHFWRFNWRMKKNFKARRTCGTAVVVGDISVKFQSESHVGSWPGNSAFKIKWMIISFSKFLSENCSLWTKRLKIASSF